MNELLDAALKYATKYKWAVFPVSQKTKKPLTPHGCKDAKKDPGAIRSWWKRYPDASIGIATGSASNLLVIDEDVDEDKGLNGVHEMQIWETDNGELPETVRAITGRGGAHLYYRYEGKDLGNRAGVIEGVDIRGEGGYIIAPPSIHPNGTQYEWECDPEETEISDINDTIKKLLAITKKSSSEKFKLPKIIESGQRNSTLYRFACSLQSQGLTDEAITAAVMAENDTRCKEPLSKDEIRQLIESALTHAKGELKVIEQTSYSPREPEFTYVLDKDGVPTDKIAQTIKNAEEAIMYDPDLYGRLRFNELSYSPNVYGNLPWASGSGWRDWTNADDSNLRSYVESKYGLKNKDKIMDALNNVIHRQTINPVKEMLETAHNAWDGNKHVENLLTRFVGAEKTPYNVEVMHRYMLGAVKRIYQPGCKFDYMLILVGKQGSYKSSFLKFLAINEEWFTDNFNTLDGDKAFEKLRGMWIVEMSELQATKRAKDVESIKAFITSSVDTYRTPYERRTEQRPRRCVLAGTSNPVDFLTDKTGNRRFLPVTCSVLPIENPYDNLEATRFEFIQAWGEIMDEYTRAGGKVSVVLPKEYEEAAIDAQMAYLEDDPNIGIIQEWLDTCDKERVCIPMIWKEALKMEYVKPSQKDLNNLHEIMRNNIKGWKYEGKQRIDMIYGTQRCYVPKAEFLDAPRDPFV
jgi:predicted P-loop ATPase